MIESHQHNINEILWKKNDVMKYMSKNWKNFLMNGSLENYQKTEHIKKCQFLLEAIRTRDSNNYHQRIDLMQAQFGVLKIIIESKNEWFYVSQSPKHLDEIDDTVQRTYEVYEAMTVEIDQSMH